MKYLWAVWPKLQRKILSKRTKLLLLDFDGTLTPISKTPRAVVVSKKTKNVLTSLNHSRLCRVAIISGRSLKDLRRYFRFKNFITIGNHGLEIKGHRFSLPTPLKKARKLKALVGVMAKKLTAIFRDVPGVWVEDKVYTLSVHYRNVPRPHMPFFRRKLSFFMKTHGHCPLIWRKGKKVWEFRPNVAWGKGETALFLLRRFPRALPIVIGDDQTDEDMFRAIGRRGITIRVGFSHRSAAHYYLKSSKEVARLINKLPDHHYQ